MCAGSGERSRAQSAQGRRESPGDTAGRKLSLKGSGTNQTTLLEPITQQQQLLHPHENLPDKTFLPGAAAAHKQELKQGENHGISNFLKIKKIKILGSKPV